jgi:hypothetical protein
MGQRLGGPGRRQQAHPWVHPAWRMAAWAHGAAPSCRALPRLPPCRGMHGLETSCAKSWVGVSGCFSWSLARRTAPVWSLELRRMLSHAPRRRCGHVWHVLGVDTGVPRLGTKQPRICTARPDVYHTPIEKCRKNIRRCSHLPTPVTRRTLNLWTSSLVLRDRVDPLYLRSSHSVRNHTGRLNLNSPRGRFLRENNTNNPPARETKHAQTPTSETQSNSTRLKPTRTWTSNRETHAAS